MSLTRISTRVSIDPMPGACPVIVLQAALRTLEEASRVAASDAKLPGLSCHGYGSCLDRRPRNFFSMRRKLMGKRSSGFSSSSFLSQFALSSSVRLLVRSRGSNQGMFSVFGPDRVAVTTVAATYRGGTFSIAGFLGGSLGR